jgi:hypothetical protein
MIARIHELSGNGFLEIKHLNERIASISRRDSITYEKQWTYLKTGEIEHGCLDILNNISSLQAGVDTISIWYQRRVLGYFVGRRLGEIPERAEAMYYDSGPKPVPSLLLFFTLGVPVAAFMFEWYSKLKIEGERNILGIYLGLFVALLGCGYIKRRYRWQDHFQDYRALAAALRVQLFWALAGLPLAASDNYLQKQAGELGWIQFALRGPALWGTALACKLKSPNRDVVINGWIKDQADYFIGEDRESGRSKANEMAADRNERLSWMLLLLGLGIAMFLFAASFVHSCAYIGCHNALILQELYHEENRKIFDVVIVVVLAIAAALAVATNLRTYRAHARNYRQIGLIFVRALDVVQKSGVTDTRFHEVVRELGREALSENAEWLMDHRDRPVDPGP